MHMVKTLWFSHTLLHFLNFISLYVLDECEANIRSMQTCDCCTFSQSCEKWVKAIGKWLWLPGTTTNQCYLQMRSGLFVIPEQCDWLLLFYSLYLCWLMPDYAWLRGRIYSLLKPCSKKKKKVAQQNNESKNMDQQCIFEAEAKKKIKKIQSECVLFSLSLWFSICLQVGWQIMWDIYDEAYFFSSEMTVSSHCQRPSNKSTHSRRSLIANYNGLIQERIPSHYSRAWVFSTSAPKHTHTRTHISVAMATHTHTWIVWVVQQLGKNLPDGNGIIH